MFSAKVQIFKEKKRIVYKLEYTYKAAGIGSPIYLGAEEKIISRDKYSKLPQVSRLQCDFVAQCPSLGIHLTTIRVEGKTDSAPTFAPNFIFTYNTHTEVNGPS